MALILPLISNKSGAFGQPQKALGHELQIDLWVANQATATAEPASETDRRRRYSQRTEESGEDEASCVLAEGHFSGGIAPGCAMEELFEWEQEPIKRCRLPRESAFDVSP